MSRPTPPSTESASASLPGTASQYRQRVRRLYHTIKPSAQFLSFWIAVALPFVYVPLLARGLADATAALTFFALLVVNILALYAGHGYNQR